MDRKKNNRKFITNENKIIIVVSPQLIRSKEYKLLIGDSSKAKKILKWEPKIDIKIG